MEDFNMFDADEPIQTPRKAPKFLPTKFKPKPKLKPNSPVMVEEALKVEDAKKEEVDNETKPFVSNCVSNVKPKPFDVEMEAVEEMEEEEEETKVAMEVDEVEDQIIREIDVFFTPGLINDDTKLFVLQYPLRPCWRPYEFDEQCEIRVKQESAEVEIDLSLDVDCPNYDTQSAVDGIKKTKQTLSSLWKPPRTTGYAIGVLVGNELHLNPIHAVVQLRPSTQHLNYGGANKNRTIKDVEVPVKIEGRKEEAVTQMKNKLKAVPNQCNMDDEQSWVALKYYGSESDIRYKYLQNMVAKESSPIQFSMSPSDYMNSWCPGAFSRDNLKGPSKRLLLLPLEERLKTWLREGPPVHRFNALKHLAPNDSIIDVLQILKRYARLVQGLWVPKSSLVIEGGQGVEVLARDYVLLLFSKCPVIKSSEINFSRLVKSLKVFLNTLAIERPSFNDWKLKEPTDVSFIKLYPETVKEQELIWADMEKQVSGAIYGSARKKPLNSMQSNPPNSMQSNKLETLKKSDKGAIRSTNETQKTAMSNETREALPKALKILFQTYKVCSFQLICQGLRDLAVSQKNSPKVDARAVVLAAQALDGPKEELDKCINQVATNIHGIYVLRSSAENPEYDLFRNVVINLFCAKGPTARLRKADFNEAAKIALKREFTTNEYNKVLHELCENRHGAWVLKKGDGDEK